MGRQQRGTRHGDDRTTWQERHTLSLEMQERERLLHQHADLFTDVASGAWII